MVGLTTALSVAVVAVARGPLPLPRATCNIIEATLLLTLLFIDVETRLVPTPLVAALTVVALAVAAGSPAGVGPALLGGIVAGGAFAVLVGLGRWAFGSDALGWGDASLALGIGTVAGFPLALLALLYGIVLGGIAALVVLLSAGRRRGATFPYGPYLVAGGLIVLVGGVHPLGI